MKFGLLEPKNQADNFPYFLDQYIINGTSNTVGANQITNAGLKLMLTTKKAVMDAI